MRSTSFTIATLLICPTHSAGAQSPAERTLVARWDDLVSGISNPAVLERFALHATHAATRADLRTTVALYRVEDGVATDSAALQVSFDQAVQRGINEVAPTLDISRLDRGGYRLEVRLTDSHGAVQVRRFVMLALD